MTFVTCTISPGIPFILISVQWSAPNQSLHIGNNLENKEIDVAWQEKHSYERLDRKSIIYGSTDKTSQSDWFIWLDRKQVL